MCATIETTIPHLEETNLHFKEILAAYKGKSDIEDAVVAHLIIMSDLLKAFHRGIPTKIEQYNGQNGQLKTLQGKLVVAELNGHGMESTTARG